MNAGAVISNLETNQKLGFGGPNMIPKSFVLGSNEYFYGSSKIKQQLAQRIFFSHLIEKLFLVFRQARTSKIFVSEGLMRTVIKKIVLLL